MEHSPPCQLNFGRSDRLSAKTRSTRMGKLRSGERVFGSPLEF